MGTANEFKVQARNIIYLPRRAATVVMHFSARLLGLFVFLALLSPLAGAQDFEFLPEIDVNAKLNSNVRLSFQAKRTRENGEPTQADIGPSIDFFVKPRIHLKRDSLYDLDESKSRLLAFSFGYRYLPSPDAPAVNRFIFQATPNLPVKGGFLLSDRNRGELNLSAGDLTWRYRNELTVQRTVRIHSYHLTPFGSAEVFYDSKYHKWSSTDLYAGARFPIRKHTQIEPYYEHENNTGKKQPQQIQAFGLILSLHF